MGADLLPRQVLELYPAHRDTIPSLIASRRAVAAERPALLFDQRTWTYAEIDEASSRLAHVLSLRGARRGECVALLSLNNDFSLLVFLAVAKLGALFVPLNPSLTDGELSHVLRHCRPTAVVVQDADRARVQRVISALEPKPGLLSLEEIDLARLRQPAGDGDRISGESVQPDDPAVVIYTSGTTGFPKGVVHSHRNFVWAGEAFVERMHLQPSDRLLTVLPFFHINALFYSWGGALAAGASLATTSRFSASQLWRLAAETGATEFNILAAVGNILTKRPRTEFDPNHRIRKIYGGPIPADVYRVFQEEFGVPIL
ncbi:MAG TPA: AMP-binding protein, partial [Myxococcaceae bacterium]|nr:AMP-binding protein [Myxococcaceae bacterium]